VFRNLKVYIMVVGNSEVQVYLKVPFKEKDQAKALGARFDPDAKAWYVPHGIDVTRFARWLPTDVAKFALEGASALQPVVKKAKHNAVKRPAVLTATPLPALRPLLPASSDPNDPPWDA
jgi:hypothetical protein